jgi:hypothetical protein
MSENEALFDPPLFGAFDSGKLKRPPLSRVTSYAQKILEKPQDEAARSIISCSLLLIWRHVKH